MRRPLHSLDLADPLRAQLRQLRRLTGYTWAELRQIPAEAARQSTSAARGRTALALDMLQALFFRRMAVRYYRYYGFARRSGAEKDAFFSRAELRQLQKRTSDPTQRPWLDDKLLFYRRCQQAGLPSIAVLGFIAAAPWHRPRGPALVTTAEELGELLRSLPGEEFFFKPVDGAFGDGATYLCQRGGRSYGWRGEEVALEQFFSHFRAPWPNVFGDPCSGFIVQPFYSNPPAIQAQNGGRALSTHKVLTALRRDGTSEIVFALHKIPAREALVDNYVRHGSIEVLMDHLSGRLCQGYRVDPRLGCPVEVTCFPGDQRPIRGYPLPSWPQVQELALRAAREFSGIRLASWDIAVCPGGAVLVEGSWQFNATVIQGHQGIGQRVLLWRLEELLG